MQPQNNNFYSVNINYPGVKDPECAGAATGCLIGCYAGHPVAGCIAGSVMGNLFEDWLKTPHLINSGGIEYTNRTITLHMPTAQRINRD